MREGKKYKIVYIGLHPETLVFLGNDPDITLCGASFLEYFFSFKTWNPVNYIFKLIYYLRVKNRFRFLELLLSKLFYFFSFLSSAIAHKYKDYLKVISEKNVCVLDMENPKKVERYIKNHKIDLAVVNSWGILSGKIIFAPKYKTINIHPSILPQYKGALPTLWSLKNKDAESAVTYIVLNESMDGGKILSQNKFKINRRDNAISLESKIEAIIKKTLNSDVKKYLSGRAAPQHQDFLGESKTAKYEEYRLINWASEKAEDIYNKIILYPFIEPGLYCFTRMGGIKIETKNAELYKNGGLDISPGDFIVKFFNVFFGAKDGIIKLRLFLDISIGDSIKIILKNKFIK